MHSDQIKYNRTLSYVETTYIAMYIPYIFLMSMLLFVCIISPMQYLLAFLTLIVNLLTVMLWYEDAYCEFLWQIRLL